MFNFFGEIKEKFVTAKDSLDGFNIINISGKLLYVEGHSGLLTLSKEIVSFKVKKSVVIVEGQGMVLDELSDNTLKISGIIKKVEQI